MFPDKRRLINYLGGLISRTTDVAFLNLLLLIKNDCERLEPEEFIDSLRKRGDIVYQIPFDNEINIGLTNFYQNLAKDLETELRSHHVEF